MPDRAHGSPAACLHGLGAVLMLCLLMFAASLASAQAPASHRWDRPAATALLAYIGTLGTHGLDPADYAPQELQAALGSGDGAALEARASLSFGLVARDLATGHLRGGQRGRYYIPSDSLDAGEVADLIDRALASKDIAGTLEGLAPRDPQYAALRAALRQLSPGQQRERHALETNLERWRWLPRERGARYLVVNIPEFELRLVDGGRVISSHRVIVGKPSTPTPQFRTEATGVIFNPPWNVPQSIVAESVGSLVRRQPSVARARGYTWRFDGGNLRVTQQPGPQNALGQMKLDMPNPFTVFIHDTASKDLFERDERTLSHGCIRTQAPFDLAAALLAEVSWDSPRIAQAVASRKTERVALARPVPVYVTYMTAVADESGAIRYLGDPYKLDRAIEAQLAQREAPALASLDYETECRLGGESDAYSRRG